MSGSDWQNLAGVIGAFALVTVVAAMVIRQLGSTIRAKAALAGEEGYRKLAERSATAQQDTARELAEVRVRMDALERILKEVE